MPAPSLYPLSENSGPEHRFIIPAEILIFDLVIQDKIFLKHPHRQSTGSDKCL